MVAEAVAVEAATVEEATVEEVAVAIVAVEAVAVEEAMVEEATVVDVAVAVVAVEAVAIEAGIVEAVTVEAVEVEAVWWKRLLRGDHYEVLNKNNFLNATTHLHITLAALLLRRRTRVLVQTGIRCHSISSQCVALKLVQRRRRSNSVRKVGRSPRLWGDADSRV